MARDSAKRDVRCDMRSCDDATARILLDRYRGLIGRIAAGFSRLDRDELQSVGQIAVIEAHVTYEPHRGVPERSWTAQVIRWRMVELAVEARERRRSEDEFQEEHALTNGHHSPEKAFFRRLLTEMIEQLSPRHQAVLEGRLRGETFEEIADSLGLSRSRVDQHEKAALVALQKLADPDYDG